MLFVVAHHDRKKLETLTQQLLLAFRGSVVYQHTDASRILSDVLFYDIDAVYLGTQATGAVLTSLLRALHRKRPELPVFLLSEAGSCSEANCEDYSALLSDSVEVDGLIEAMQAAQPPQLS